MSEPWVRWEGQVIEGRFPLERCIGSSDHSGVFLTRHPTESSVAAALKLVPAIPTLADWQLGHWAAAAGHSHPHLLALLSWGRCQLGADDYLYVVMEHADQNLGELLQHRALTEDEARELLVPALDALGFLHRRHLVQGQFKPSNILVVGEQLKLASDTIRPAGEATASIARPSVYDPPEARDGTGSSAGDIWALGVTLIEGLTRTRPSAPVERGARLLLPPQLPVAFSRVIRKCLADRSSDRPTVAELEAWVRQVGSGHEAAPEIGREPVAARKEAAEPMAAEPIAAESVRAESVDAQPPNYSGVQQQPAPRGRRVVMLTAAALAVLLLSWTAERLFVHFDAPSSQSPATSSVLEAPSNQAPSNVHAPVAHGPVAQATVVQPSSQQTDTPASHSQSNEAPPSTTAPLVVHQEIPQVPRSARATIRGHVKVGVRVTVNSAGAVVGEALAEPGPSRYFARLATTAARKWRFSRVDDRGSRQLLLRFVFSREGTTGHVASLRAG
jgi:serine/threonine protein kinase